MAAVKLKGNSSFVSKELEIDHLHEKQSHALFWILNSWNLAKVLHNLLRRFAWKQEERHKKWGVGEGSVENNSGSKDCVAVSCIEAEAALNF